MELPIVAPRSTLCQRVSALPGLQKVCRNRHSGSDGIGYTMARLLPPPAVITQRRVVVTGLGAVTPLANGMQASWERLLDGRCGIKRMKASVDGAHKVRTLSAACYCSLLHRSAFLCNSPIKLLLMPISKRMFSVLEMTRKHSPCPSGHRRELDYHLMIPLPLFQSCLQLRS